MSFLFREIQRQHETTRGEIATVSGKIDTVESKVDTAISDIASAETSIKGTGDVDLTQVKGTLDTVNAAVGALQNNVSGAISVPSTVERPDIPDSGTNTRIFEIRFYNYDANGGMVNTDSLPTLTLSDSSGSFVTNGSGGTGGNVSINGLGMISLGTGVYQFLIEMTADSTSSLNMDLGDYTLEITAVTNSITEKYPRSLEVVELSGIESGFSDLETQISTFESDLNTKLGDFTFGGSSSASDLATLLGDSSFGGSGPADFASLLGDPTTASNFTATDFAGQLDELKVDAAQAAQKIGALNSLVDLAPWGADIASGDKIAGDPDSKNVSLSPATFSVNSDSFQVMEEYEVVLPSSSNTSVNVTGSVVTYDLVWVSRSQSSSPSGGATSRWMVSESTVTGAVDRDTETSTRRYVTDAVSANQTTSFVKHSRFGEVKSPIHNNSNNSWFLTLLGKVSNTADTYEFQVNTETRIKFNYVATAV